VTTRLTAEALDAIGATMMAIRDQGMERSISDAVVGTGAVAAGEALRDDASWRTAPAPALPPGTHA
jgi:hypothetical protein